MNDTLVLSVKKKWYDLIYQRKKKEEYRALNDYWKARFGFAPFPQKKYKYVEFRNGYGRKVPSFKIELLEIVIFSPTPQHGELQEFDFFTCFVLRLGEIIE